MANTVFERTILKLNFLIEVLYDKSLNYKGLSVKWFVKGVDKMLDIKFVIKETVGIISEGSKGWKKELNLISWSDKEPKYDIRDWDPYHAKMGKGVTLSKEELRSLKKILNEINI